MLVYKNNKVNTLFLIFKNVSLFLIVFLLFSSQTNAETITHSTTVHISATVVEGGGDVGITIGQGPGYSSSTVNFSGKAFPYGKVYVLKNNELAVIKIADSQANFSISLNNISAGTYNFVIFGEDSNGTKSPAFSFPLYITSGTVVNVKDIFIAPTINIDKTSTKRGENLHIFGQSVPNYFINFLFNPLQGIEHKTTSNKNGIYSYTIDTIPFNFGKYTVKSKATKNNNISAYSMELPFSVGFMSENNKKTACFTYHGDLNCDGKTNMIDFSIMAYWYKKNNFPQKIDLNEDGQITISDFSVLVFYW